MSKIKLYIYGFIALIIAILCIEVNFYLKKYKAEKAEKERLWQNNLQLTAQNNANQSLVYTQKEWLRIKTDSLDSALKRLKIAPKSVLKIVEKLVMLHDTIKKDIPVYIIGKDQWHISDKDKCWTWEADAYLWNDSLQIDRTLFDYHNKTTDIFSRKLKFKFLFIRFYSKKEIQEKSVSECGESTERTIIIIK